MIDRKVNSTVYKIGLVPKTSAYTEFILQKVQFFLSLYCHFKAINEVSTYSSHHIPLHLALCFAFLYYAEVGMEDDQKRYFSHNYCTGYQYTTSLVQVLCTQHTTLL